MPAKRAAKRAARRRPPVQKRRARSPGKGTPRPRFVGRDPSPVLDRYPPKDPSLTLRAPPPPPPEARSSSAKAPPPSPPALAPAAPPPPGPLIRLESPFDIDSFSEQLGENTIQIKVPREDLGEVLRRITDFMGFGIYVYRFSVRPEPADQLKQFVLEMQRVDYSPAARDWTPFEEKGRSESPFGPGSTR